VRGLGFPVPFVLVVACGPATEASPRYPLHAVVGPALASAEARVTPVPAPPSPDADTLEHVDGLLTMLAEPAGRSRWSHGDMAGIALEELTGLGEEATAVCAAVLEDGTAPGGRRIAAARGLGAIGTPAAADALCRVLESAPESWLRARCATMLGEAGVDRVLPRMLLRLKYEKDGATVIELAGALARLGNLSGLDGLQVLVAGGATPELRAEAARRLAQLAGEAGLDDVGELARRWNSPEADSLAAPPPSAALELETWHRIASLAEWNLRTVDESRFVLARMNPWVAGALAEALHDENVYVRLHAAQCLERMGPRAAPSAGAALIEALAEPGIASAAATALGAIRVRSALDALTACVAPAHEVELRIAAVRALAALGDDAARPVLQGLFATEVAVDLRQAAATALLALGESGEPVRFLRACLEDPFADRGAAEDALGRWLDGLPGVADVRQAWHALDPTPGTIPTAEETKQRLRERGALLESLP
jgi:HEAT repeat protein